MFLLQKFKRRYCFKFLMQKIKKIIFPYSTKANLEYVYCGAVFPFPEYCMPKL